MKKIKLINSIMLGSLGIAIPTALMTSCNKGQQDIIELVRGEKNIIYTSKTKGVNLIFKASDAKAIDSLKVKVTNIVVSGAEAKSVAGLSKCKYDSGGNIAVTIYPQVFKAQWPQATINFSLSFTSKTTGFSQTIDGFSLEPTAIAGEYDLKNGSYDVMETEEHSVIGGEVYAYTCNFKLGWERMYKCFSFLRTDVTNDVEAEYLPIEYININKNGTALIQDRDFTLNEDSTIVELADEHTPTLNDEFIFEVVFKEDGQGKFVNAEMWSTLDVEGTTVNGFKTDVTDEEIEYEFNDEGATTSTKSLVFYSHITDIADNAFNPQVTTKKKMPASYDSVSFYKATGEVNIGNGAFAENTALVELQLPWDPQILGGYVRTIGDTAFAYCTALQGNVDPNWGDVGALIFEDGLESVGAGAFNHCESVLSLTIPSSCTTIGIGAFSYMKKLHDIDFSSWTDVPSSTTTGTGIFKGSGSVYYATDYPTILIGANQDKNAWKAWLDNQEVDWTIWQLKKVGE